MHPRPGNWMAIRCKVVYYAWAFSTGIKYRHCKDNHPLAGVRSTGPGINVSTVTSYLMLFLQPGFWNS